MTLEDYIERYSSPEPEWLSRITRDTYQHVLNPHMLSGQVQGRLLSMLSHMLQPKYILELGTYTGYSALSLAEGLAEGGQVYTIEHNDELEDTIRRNIASSPYADRITLLLGDAKTIIGNRESEIENRNFDLVFIDADKREYCAYYDLIYSRVRVGGYILADNTLWDGHVVDSAYDRDAQTLGLRAFNERIATDERVKQVILPVRDGLTLIRKLC